MVRLTPEEKAELPAIRQRIKVRQENIAREVNRFKQSLKGDSYAGYRTIAKGMTKVSTPVEKKISSAAGRISKNVDKSLKAKAVYKKGKAFGGTYDIKQQLQPVQNYSYANPYFQKEWKKDNRSLFFK